MPTHNFIDRTGQRFGRLVAIERVAHTGEARWLCICDCGIEVIASAGNLTSGNTSSCGCHKRDMVTARVTSHGMHGSRTYRAWQAMKARCSNPKHAHWDRYGGRGITVCERWRLSFESFLEDMGEAPSRLHSLDRFPNPEGNYEPGNCRWATQSEQCRNKSNNRLLTSGGTTMTVIEWSERLGVRPGLLYHRIRRGWSDDRVLTISQGAT